MARQAWNRKGEWDRDVLEHIRSMLLVLAALIERAAGLSIAERLRFLAVMGCGEAELRRLIVAMASGRCPGAPTGLDASKPPAVELCPRTTAGDAALLAARFRVLALAVEAMLAQTGPRPLRLHPCWSISRANSNGRLASQYTPSPALRATSPP